jgi:sodium-coupled monocarboxylate transporter 8/12
MFYLTGTVLYGFYRVLPDRAPAFLNAHMVPRLAIGEGIPIANDRLLPFFVTSELPSPLPGLLIAAILGATMAVVSAGVNALATAALMDFRGKRRSVSPEDRSELNKARILTALFGVMPTLLALFVIAHLGTLIEGVINVNGLFGGPLLGIFFLGVLSKRANGNGALIGALAGVITGVAVFFSRRLCGYELSFLWIAFFSTAVTWTVGWLASWLFPAPSPAVVRELVHPWRR